jgi:DNA-directed RNA polymerase specialized sigma subunit
MAVRDELILAHLGIVPKLARAMHRGMRWVGREELEGMGYLALTVACQRLDRKKLNGNSVYRYCWLRTKLGIIDQVRSQVYNGRRQGDYPCFSSLEAMPAHCRERKPFLVPSPEKQYVAAVDVSTLMSTLPLKQARVVRMRLMEDIPPEEIANKMKMSVSWVHQLRVKATREMRVRAGMRRNANGA